MAEFKCTNCGGIMQTDETNEYVVCEYCGTKQKIEKSEAEIKADLLRKKEEQKAQYREEFNKTTKKIRKGLMIILIVFITIIVLFFGSEMVMGIIEVFSEDNEPTTSNTTENIYNEASTSSYDNDIQYTETIEIAELFNGDLETVEELLEPQSKAPQDIEAYTKYTFNCVTVMCEYGTNNIYSISVDYTNENTNVDYTVFGLNKNTTQTNWESALGEMFFQGYDSNDNPVYSYELEYDENTTYDVEITATSEYPDKITVYKY